MNILKKKELFNFFTYFMSSLQSSRVSTVKLTYSPAGYVHNYPFPVCKRQYYQCVVLCCSETTR